MIQSVLQHVPILGARCNDANFFGLPTWYKYLENASSSAAQCSPKFDSITDVWLVLLAISEILLRVAIIIAIAYVLIGGFKYITSDNSPEKTKNAKHTVIDALIGLAIAMIATAAVGFIAGRIN